VSVTPFLSVVVPALNEERCIGSFIERMRDELSRLVPSWEIVVVDDGSRDRTASIVAAEASRDPRVRLISGPHRGKGAALQQGLLAATGDWRFMADADLAMPPDNLARFLTAIDGPDRPQIVIGSREAPGSQRAGEPVARHVIGRVFNWVVRLFALPGIHDTQCGFKLFSRAAVETLFPRLTIPGFAMDVELLFLARRAGLALREVGIIWRGRADSRVAVGRGVEAFLDVLRLRWRWRDLSMQKAGPYPSEAPPQTGERAGPAAPPR
jgi:dolichyl-phosphate beta-glucosyltransferase